MIDLALTARDVLLISIGIASGVPLWALERQLRLLRYREGRRGR